MSLTSILSYCFFFFKQKTAYEMRISDWSSDVCSSDLLDTVLDTIATYKERIESLKGKIKKALFYPAGVIAVAIGVSALLLIFVVPQFEELFKGFGADLPAFTQLLVDASRFITANGFYIVVAIAGAIFAFIQALKRSRPFAQAIDRFMLKLPVIGQILHQSAIARFARTLALTFKAGVPLVEALETCRSEEHTSELQSLMRISYAVFCLKKKKKTIIEIETRTI